MYSSLCKFTCNLLFLQAESECDERLTEALEYSDLVSEISSAATKANASPLQPQPSPRAIAHSAHLQASHAFFDRLRAPWYSTRAANLHYRLASLLYKNLMAHHAEVCFISLSLRFCLPWAYSANQQAYIKISSTVHISNSKLYKLCRSVLHTNSYCVYHSFSSGVLAIETLALRVRNLTMNARWSSTTACRQTRELPLLPLYQAHTMSSPLTKPLKSFKYAANSTRFFYSPTDVRTTNTPLIHCLFKA